MTTIEQLKSAVRTSIKPNGRQEITGGVLQETLIKIIDAVYSAIPDVVNDLVSGGSAKSLSAEQGKLLKTAIDDVLRSLENKQDKLNFDNTPVVDSDNPVTSDGIFKAIQSVLTSLSETMNSDYQKKSDEALDTKVKEVVPAINEVNEKVSDSESRKADKIGYYPDMAVGESDFSTQLVDGKAALTDTSSYALRPTGGTLDIESGVSAITHVYGRTDKQLIPDGNFAAFKPENFVTYNTTVDKSGDLLNIHISQALPSNASLTDKPVTAGHRYLLYGLISFPDCVNYNIIYATGSNVSLVSQLRPMEKNVFVLLGCLFSASNTGNVQIVFGHSNAGGIGTTRVAWVKMYDLTEQGLDSKVTTVEQGIAIFGTGYSEGLCGSRPIAKHTTGFNQFSPSGRGCGVLKGKNLTSAGVVANSDGMSVFWLPCIEGMAYNLHSPRITGADGFAFHRVGFSHFPPDSAGFTAAENIVYGQRNNSVYTPPQNGYMVVSVSTDDDADLKSIIAHLKHSYTDFSKQYDGEHEYRLSSRPLGFGELDGIGTYRDEADLVKRRMTRRTARIDLAGLVWAKADYGFYTWSLHETGLYVSGLVLCDGYPVVGSTDTPGGIIFRRDGVLAVTDTSFPDVASFKASLAGRRAVVALAEPVVTDIEVGSNAQYVNDFGTEELEYEGAMPTVTTEYYNNLVDKLRNMPAPADIAVVSPMNGGTSALRPLYEAAGAVYNETTGFYELNGLNDITEKQMADIYIQANDIIWELSYKNIRRYSYASFRTNTSSHSIDGYSDWFKKANNNLYLDNTFVFCKNLEVLNINGGSEYDVYVRIFTAAFYGCEKLKTVIGILDVEAVASFASSFLLCQALENITMKNLKADVDFKDSSLLSDASILYMVQNAANGDKAITITLHPDALARANANSDIQSAITKNGHITLVSA